MPHDLAIAGFTPAQRWRSLVAVIASVFGVGVSVGAGASALNDKLQGPEPVVVDVAN
jgi:hypothetical protein